MSQFTGQMNAREILYAFANVQRQQDGVRKAKSGLSGQLMELAKPYSVVGDKEYGQCVNDMERASRAETLANMFAEYLKPVEEDFKKRENDKIPGAWSQAKSDIKAAIKLELDIESFDSFDALKKEKLAANKARKDAENGTSSGGDESAESEGDSLNYQEHTIDTDSAVVAQYLDQLSALLGDALGKGLESEVIGTLEDACIRIASHINDHDESVVETEQPQLAQAS